MDPQSYGHRSPRMNRDHALAPLLLSSTVVEGSLQQPPLASPVQENVNVPALHGSVVPSGNQMYIKRHVRRRLGHAKESCDKELKKVINSITSYVEERIQEPDYDDLPSHVLPSDTASEDGGDEADVDVSVSSRHSRYRESPIVPTIPPTHH